MVSAYLLSFALIATNLVHNASGRCRPMIKKHCKPRWNPYGNHCYLVHPPPGKTAWFSFEGGEEFCQGFSNKQGKGHLVSILDQKEQDFVIELMSNIKPGENFWIGLTDAEVEGVFKWTDGSVLSYQNWANEEPAATWETEDYVEMRNGKWNDATGDQAHARQTIMCKMAQSANI